MRKRWHPKPQHGQPRDFSRCRGPAPDRLRGHREHQGTYDRLPDFVREWVANNPEYIDVTQVWTAWHGVKARYPRGANLPDRDYTKRQKQEMTKILDQATAEAAGIHDEEMQKAFKELDSYAKRASLAVHVGKVEVP